MSGYQTVRDALDRSCNPAFSDPNILVVDVDLLGDRVLKLEHRQVDGVPLDDDDKAKTLQFCKYLWGYEVEMRVREDA
jgi:spore cortex formation protein SpoVR/YcgB (stage V sporulation)